MTSAISNPFSIQEGARKDRERNTSWNVLITPPSPSLVGFPVKETQALKCLKSSEEFKPAVENQINRICIIITSTFEFCVVTGKHIKQFFTNHESVKSQVRQEDHFINI